MRLATIILFGLAALLSPRAAAHADMPVTRLDALSPPGGRQGATFELRISAGANLDGVDELLFSHRGITAVQKTAAADAAGGASERCFDVTIAHDVPPGIYDVRAVGWFGVSNPRALAVDTLREIADAPQGSTTERPIELAVGSIVNGVAGVSAADWFSVAAGKGQTILVEALAQRIDSRLEARLTVFDPTGRELAHRPATVDGDPWVAFEASADGDYRIRLHDVVYRGGAEYFYRLRVSGGDRSHARQPTFAHRLRLPESVTIDDFSAYQLVDGQGAGPSAPAPSPCGVVGEVEPNNHEGAAQPIVAPCEVAGQFYPVRDRDWFSFTAAKAQELRFEVVSSRLGLPTDAHLVVQQVTASADGRTELKDLAEADDQTASGGGALFSTATADPVLRFVAPADGDYRVMVRDLFGDSRSDPRMTYRLIVREPAPDFRLAAVPADSDAKNAKLTSTRDVIYGPSSTHLRRGGTAAIDVLALRQDGFKGAIEVEVAGLPHDVQCRTATIGAGQNAATLVLEAAHDAAAWRGELTIVGRARVGGQVVSRSARIGTVVWPNPLRGRNVARMAQSLAASVSAHELSPGRIVLGEAPAATAARGATVRIPVRVERTPGFDASLAFTAMGLPAGVQAKPLTIAAGETEGALEITVSNSAPLLRHSWHVRALTKAPYSPAAIGAAMARAAQEAAAEAVASATVAAEAAQRAAADAANAALVADDALRGMREALSERDSSAAASAADALEAARRLNEVRLRGVVDDRDEAAIEAWTSALEAARTETAAAENRARAADGARLAAFRAVADAQAQLAMARGRARVASDERAAAQDRLAAAETLLAAETKRADEAASRVTLASTDLVMRSGTLDLVVVEAPRNDE